MLSILPNRTARHSAIAAAATLGLTASLFLSGVGQSEEPKKGEPQKLVANEPQKEGPAHMDDFARASAPEWNFPRANRNDPCWPEDPFDDEGNPKEGVLNNWPNSDGGCHPLSDEEEDMSSEEREEKGVWDFPTFYTARKCNPDEVRVAYTIFQASSGFKPSGHPQDFEHIDVIWNKHGEDWTRSRLLLSQHKGHDSVPWDEAESWNADRGSAGLGREFPRIFVGYGSHAMFNDQEKGLKDVLSAYTDLEYRQDDYPHWSDRNKANKDNRGLVKVEPGGDLYKKFKEHDNAFGGTTTPADAADDMCEHS
ncbi:hypothetical protein OIE63_14155 [Streptomyces sp. NBC_01795]|uniref:hypothetical protein n=1 Tax=unclassified Streptomyces TaxID=2593676 RepID=UPI002DDC1381|nr:MULTISPECIES: hypothetical protein [unclassified Streptomyces]WSA92576.1 hypothetical protein OIE63_14155 [Streptomyces sp. NBC_01795]WSB76943.1 hypothetical protein OHB04_14960 [Streptomyces sp. NBC_01775]